jgi:hypothetical protein
MPDSPLPPNSNGDDKFALRRLLREMTDGEHELARKLRAFEATERDAKHTIERHSRVEHWGREPERPWAWRAPAPDPERRKRSPGR